MSHCPIGQKWRISAPGIAFNNPGIIDLFSYKVEGCPHKGGYWIVNCNPKCTFCPLVPKRDTLYVTDGSLMPNKGQVGKYGLYSRVVPKF